MIHTFARGHPIYYNGETWLYADTDTTADVERPCVKCGELPTPEGYDACLGHIAGVRSACCGHGVEFGYIVWDNLPVEMTFEREIKIGKWKIRLSWSRDMIEGKDYWTPESGV